MTVKTCVVFGHIPPEGMGTSQNVFESAPFGYSCEYETAHHFIQTVKEAYPRLLISQVVIG